MTQRDQPQRLTMECSIMGKEFSAAMGMRLPLGA